MDACLWKDVINNDMIEGAPLLRWNCIKTEDPPSRPLDKGVPASWSISSWSLHLFFNTLDLPWQTNHTRQASRKRQAIFQWDRRLFFFFFSENIGTAAAEPAGPAPAPLGNLNRPLRPPYRVPEILHDSTVKKRKGNVWWSELWWEIIVK